jgi:hypothetical protein
VAKDHDRSATDRAQALAARTARRHGVSRWWRCRARVYKPFGAASGCDDAGSQRRFGECSFHHQPVTSFRQIEANRRNALRSTGPTTEDGKRRSRQNAVRHGLSAETIVEVVEDIDDYRGFEAAIIADYDARTAVERELVLRLASLLWRLRRATLIETELLRIQAEGRDRRSSHLTRSRNTASQIPGNASAVQDVQGDQADGDPWPPIHSISHSAQPVNSARDLAHCFLRLANLDNGIFERLGRYESGLARQVTRTLFLLKSARVL